jgi:hypothetical protein
MSLAIVQALLSSQMGFISAIQSAFTWPHDAREKRPNNWGCTMSGMFKFSVTAYDPAKIWLIPHISLENMKNQMPMDDIRSLTQAKETTRTLNVHASFS